MLPLLVLILLSTVCLFATGAFVLAIYYTTKTRIERKRAKDAEADSELRTPLRETAAEHGLSSSSPPIPPPPRPPTPKAESAPPLPDDGEIPSAATERVQAMKSKLQSP